MSKIATALVVPIICFLFHSGLASAENKALLTDIEFISLSNTTEHVVLKFNGSYSPKTFRLKGEKPRLVFDFYGITITNRIQNAYTTNGSLIKAIRVGLHKGDNPKTRVVFDEVIGKTVAYNQEFDESSYTLTIALYQDGSQPPATVAPKSVQAEPIEERPLAAKEAAAPEPSSAEQEDKAAEQPPNAVNNSTPISTPTAAKETTAGVQETTLEPGPPAKETEPTATGSSVPGGQEQPVLEAITFDANSSKGEMVLFKLNGFHPPTVYGVEEGLPRAVCDFKNTVLHRDVKSEIIANGKYVRAIRVGKHVNPDKIRVVLDLEPSNNYDLQQIFFREDRLFVILVNTLENLPGAPGKDPAP